MDETEIKEVSNRMKDFVRRGRKSLSLSYIVEVKYARYQRRISKESVKPQKEGVWG